MFPGGVVAWWRGDEININNPVHVSICVSISVRVLERVVSVGEGIVKGGRCWRGNRCRVVQFSRRLSCVKC